MGNPLNPLLLALGIIVLLFGWDASAQTLNSTCPLKYCNSLTALGAILSYDYNAQNGSLNIAFQAKPAATGGWVAWGINPQGLKMVGTQALIAFRLGNGTTIVETYNVNSTSTVTPSKISFNVTNKTAVYESSSGKITIFASLVLDPNLSSVNQVWQVGSKVSNMIPGIHEFDQANRNSLGKLNLQTGSSSAPPAESPTSAANNTPTPTSNSNCPSQFTEGGSKTYKFCSNLNLGATLSYIFHQQNSSLDIAFQAAPTTPAGWVGWGINPQGLRMIGTQALIAFKASNGSTVVGTYNVVSKNNALNPSSITLNVTNKSAVYESSSGKITIFASLILDPSQTSVNQVWQVGSSVTGSSPSVHSLSQADLKTTGTLDVLSGTTSASGSSPHQTLKNRHGVITVVSWGILMPIGVIIARYAKTFESADPAWFYLHAFCQTSGYAIGVAGWATGLRLGSYSKGVEQTSHRKIGIALFAVATLQVFALLLRPKKDHKFRLYWNIYHHSIGYSVIILSIINIFKGFDILDPEKKWKRAYIGVIIALGAIAVFLEIVTWIIYFQRKSKNSSKRSSEMNGNGRSNGNGQNQSYL